MPAHACLHFLPFLTPWLEVDYEEEGFEEVELEKEDFKEEVELEEEGFKEEVKLEGAELECWCQCCALVKLLPLEPPYCSYHTRRGLLGKIILITSAPSVLS